MEGFAREAVESQLLTPLPDECVDEMQWYFGQARKYPAPTRSSNDLDERFYRDRTALGAARFKVLYRLWHQDGDAVSPTSDRPRSPMP
jgi:hypothetical protein